MTCHVQIWVNLEPLNHLLFYAGLLKEWYALRPCMIGSWDAKTGSVTGEISISHPPKPPSHYKRCKPPFANFRFWSNNSFILATMLHWDMYYILDFFALISAGGAQANQHARMAARGVGGWSFAKPCPEFLQRKFLLVRRLLPPRYSWHLMNPKR